jgi:pimeloyl-ACP methyl ester carboxylesterase
MVVAAPPARASHVEHVAVPSPADGLPIWMSVYKPDGAGPDRQVPMIVHSHGWGGSRTSSEDAFGDWLEAGFGVVSFDQRGFGETGGTTYAMDPDLEGQDVKGVIDHVASLDWVRKDRDASGQEIIGDPVIGAIGGSYGGGYQLVGALTEVRDTGRTRFNALAPEITWNNIARGLAPSDVPRTLWTTLLTAISAGSLPPHIRDGVLVAAATGTMPNGEIPGIYNLKDMFYRHSPAWFADNGYDLDIPVLFGQGTSDNLLPLNEAYHNYESVLTDAARARSIVVGYNGGHALPSVVPPGVTSGDAVALGGVGDDACSGGFEQLSRAFFQKVFGGEDPSVLLPANYNVTSATGECIHVDRLDDYTTKRVGSGVVATPSTVGAPLAFPIVEGPVTVAGIPILKGSLTAVGAETRAFFALSVGETPATARILQNNVMPLRQRLPAIRQPVELELAGVAAVVPAGQTLYLTVSAVSDMFAGNNRYPGAMLLEDAVVDVPLTGAA